MAERVIDYAVPRSEILRAQKKDQEGNTTANVSRLRQKAQTLFADMRTTGEGGELLLYLLTQAHLRIPQLLCKMPLKTNPQMYYHGVDGIHASFEAKSGKLLLYWGESKLYQDLSSAISHCLGGLQKYLTDTGGTGSPLERDLFLIQENIDLANPELEDAILRFLDRDNEGFNSVEYRGIALIGFDSKHYPNTCYTKTTDQVCCDLLEDYAGWIQKLDRALETHNALNKFTLELFLLPFPDVQRFRDAFLREVGHHGDTSTTVATT